VTKADLGEPADRARRDLTQALAAVGSNGVPVLAVSAVPPPTGVEELAEALDDHRARVDVGRRRTRSRRLSALRELVAEHGEQALRGLGGRREAERVLSEQDPSAHTAALVRMLERRVPP